MAIPLGRLQMIRLVEKGRSSTVGSTVVLTIRMEILHAQALVFATSVGFVVGALEEGR